AARRIHRPHGRDLRRPLFRRAFRLRIDARPAAPANDPRAGGDMNMRTRRQFLVAVAVLAAPIAPLAAYAESRRERNRRILFQRLGSAASQDEGRRAEDDIWRMWLALAPTPAVEEAVAEAMRRRDRYD